MDRSVAVWVDSGVALYIKVQKKDEMIVLPELTVVLRETLIALSLWHLCHAWVVGKSLV